MTHLTLLLVEATGLQNYIFGSNELKQNIGASELVQQATQDWVFERLPEPHNVTRDDDSPDGSMIAPPQLAGDLAAEVIYAGGGNTLLLFKEEVEAQSFTRVLTKYALTAAPGLNLVVQHQPFDPAQGSLKKALHCLRRAAAERKRNPLPNAPLLGLGVTAACVYTGAPAVAVDEGPRLVSAEVLAKRQAAEKGKKRLHRHLSDVQRANYEFVSNFDAFSEGGESSHLAVIHTDGNGMGKRIEALGEGCDTADSNAEYARLLYQFSESVKRVARSALSATVGMMLDPQNLEDDEIKKWLIAPTNGELRFRPIVFGGDDITFVCEGHLGLSLARKYVTEFSARTLSDGKPASARAGVAVVHAHYPFARAYDLAEELAKSAKKYTAELADKREPGVPVMDWHFAVGGLISELREIRAREYTEDAGNLTLRPVRLDRARDDDLQSWRAFTAALHAFQNDPAWAGRRNKVKALRDALRAGPETVQVFMGGDTLPEVLPRTDAARTGWYDKRCAYFDAVEALDFYIELYGEAE